MSPSIVNSYLPNTEPRYAQTNLCLPQLQETEDTQISQKLILLSDNHEDLKHPQNPSTPSYKLVFKKSYSSQGWVQFCMDWGPILSP